MSVKKLNLDDIGVLVQAPATTLAGYGITDGGAPNGNSFRSVFGNGANAAANGTALKAAYAAAKALTPNGNALSATNRACVLVYPGIYDLGASAGTNGLLMGTQYVDLIGVGGVSTGLAGATGGSIFITSSGRTIAQTANDVLIQGVTLSSTSSGAQSPSMSTSDAAYFPNTNLTAAKLVNVACVGTVLGHRTAIIYSGTYINCTAGSYAFGCYGTAVGIFTNCSASINSFGASNTASGTFVGCTASTNAFGGGGGAASGTFTDCLAGDYSFGGAGDTTGGLFTGCTGGLYSFGGGIGTAAGTCVNCVGEWASFGGDGGTLNGHLYACRLLNDSFQTVSGGGTTRYCVGDGNVTDNQG